MTYNRTWSDDDLRHAVEQATSIATVLRLLGLSVRPGNYSTIRKYIQKLGLNTEHFKGQAHGTTKPRNKRDLQEVLVENSDYAQHALKRRILKEKLLPYVCIWCGNPGMWKDRDLVLVLDHINGVRTDNRLENLRFLCPNCNSQTSTFCRGSSA